MRRLAFVGLSCVIVACGGAASTDLFGTSASGTDTSGGDGGTESSADGAVSPTDSGKTTSSDGSTQSADSGGSGTDSSTPDTCTVNSGGAQVGCPAGEVCISKDCKTGTCAKVSHGNDAYTPACGCDSVNYWNRAVAADLFAGVKADGVCPNPLACTGSAGSATCPGLEQASCAFERTALVSGGPGLVCGPDKGGVCWGLPMTCPAEATGVNECADVSACDGLCDAIRKQTPYHVQTPACTVK